MSSRNSWCWSAPRVRGPFDAGSGAQRFWLVARVCDRVLGVAWPDAVMDIYAMYACISRASKSLKEGNKSADHEVLLTNTFCLEAKERVQQNLAHMTTASATLDKNRVSGKRGTRSTTS